MSLRSQPLLAASVSAELPFAVSAFSTSSQAADPS